MRSRVRDRTGLRRVLCERQETLTPSHRDSIDVPKRLVRLASLLQSRNPSIAALLERAREHEAIRRRVFAVLPENARSHCISVVGGKQGITLYADSPAWATRLQFLRGAVASSLTPSSGEGSVRIRIKVLPELLRDPRAKFRRHPLQITNEARNTILSAAEGIADDGLRAALVRLAYRASATSGMSNPG